MIRLADAMRRGRYAVAAAWLIAAVLSLAASAASFGTKLNDLLSNRFDLPGTESEHARSLLADHFGQRPDSGYTIVFAGDVAPGRAGRSAEARRERPARRPRRPAAAGGTGPGVRADRHAARAPAGAAARRADAARDRRGACGGRVYVSGQVAINHDLQPVFDADLSAAR